MSDRGDRWHHLYLFDQYRSFATRAKSRTRSRI